jgi:hypothetical protein
VEEGFRWLRVGLDCIELTKHDFTT